MRKLESLGVQEMKKNDLLKTNGGNWIGVAVAVALYVASEWDDISDGFSDGVGGKSYNYK